MQKIVAGLVSRRRKIIGQEYLFIEYKKYPGMHGLCGGHLERGEDNKETLRREFYEELGVKFVPHELKHIMPADIPGEDIEIWDGEIDSDKFVLQSEEVVSAKWMSPKEVVDNPTMFFPAIYKYFKDNQTSLS